MFIANFARPVSKCRNAYILSVHLRSQVGAEADSIPGCVFFVHFLWVMSSGSVCNSSVSASCRARALLSHLYT
jgi:hypothetical protein